MLSYESISNEDLIQHIKIENKLISGPNKKLSDLTIEHLSKNVFNIAVFDNYNPNTYGSGLIKSPGKRLIAIGSLSLHSDGTSVSLISVLPEYQKQGIAKKIVRHLATQAKLISPRLFRNPTSEGAHALSSVWKEIALELNFPIMVLGENGMFYDIALPEEKVKLFKGQVPQKIIFTQDGQEQEGTFCRLEPHFELITLVVIMMDKGQGNFIPVTKPLAEVKIVW